MAIRILNPLESPGRNNPKYKIGSYYGSRYLSVNLFQTYTVDSPSIVQWSNGLFLPKNETNLIWLADEIDSTIKTISNNIVKIAIGQSMDASYRDGDASNALLNKPSSLVCFQSSSFPANKTKNYSPYVFKNNNSECIYADYSNYTSCLNNTTDENNVENNLVKLIYFPNSTTSSVSSIEYIFISDKGNNCIRKLNVLTAEVSTYAGICDPNNPGFKDGPLGTNQFNQPDGLGIDDDGNLFVYDSGNLYIRLITTDGYVHTLINGACFEYTMEPSYPNDFNYKRPCLLCFKNWIKTSGMPDGHILVQATTQTCYKNYVQCNVTDPLIRNPINIS